ncbi:MAG: DNA topoisomerase IB [Pseudomonadota bacterium]
MAAKIAQSPRRAAKRAGLHYISDTMPGISRHGRPGRFFYTGPSGKRVRDKATLKRIAALAIPPAWRDVWIAPDRNAHMAATGRDAKGRKQYRYHAAFAASRDADKYAHLASFAKILPALRKRLRTDLRRPGMPREKVLAAVVTLLEETLIRVGNEDYARTNHSFGLTTLRNRHVRVRGSEMRFLFRGKSGKQWNLSIRDRRVAHLIRDCQDLPGQHLFGYRNGDGTVHAVTSTDVNAYLREISGRDITAKDFRTWAGTVAAARAFAAWDGDPGPRAIRTVVAQVAARLGNTVAVCRKCYIHPSVIAGFQDGSLSARQGISERAVLRFLTQVGKK